jgi:anthranilate synthase component I
VDQAFPDKKGFLKLAARYNVVPVTREIHTDLETPVSCFLKAGDRPYSYLLESVEGGEKVARFTFIGVSASMIFKSRGRTITIEEPGKAPRSHEAAKDPLAELEKLLGRYRQAPVADLPPFCGGAVGYLGYDTVRFFEKVPDKNKDKQGIPESLFIFTDTLFVFDHIHKKLKVVCNVFLDKGVPASDAYDRAVEKLDAQVRRLRSAAPARGTAGGEYKQKVSSNFTRASFRSAVLKAKRYIKVGDIFQVVLSQAFKTPLKTGAFEVYRALRSVNPSPYMFYINAGDFQLVGSSPEVHVRCEDGKALLRPIAGTRKRGKNEAEDRRLEKELLADTKERAEHLMLVDLGRNDLGRVCEYKSVKVPEFMVIERYSHVMHIVSLVEGLLKKGKTPFDALRATFPAGTVSGAPKVRAMEIIDELENQRRGLYAGVVGYFSFSGNFDSCIAIRTILVKDGHALVQAGAGVVADSDPDKEYDETVNKARAMMKAIELAEKGQAS